MSGILEQIETNKAREEKGRYDHFAKRLWERHGIASTPAIYNYIKEVCRMRGHFQIKENCMIYRVKYSGRMLFVWMDIETNVMRTVT